jgi:polysaccharide export outer membrane protein
MYQAEKITYSLQTILFLLMLVFCPRPSIAEVAETGVPDYALGTGDTVRIQVYNEETLYLESRVSDRGMISYHFFGEMKVTGLTPGQLADLIASKLKGDYLINPNVSVDIIEYRQFYVNGEVESPGGFPFQPGITVRKAISLAGGFNDLAAKEKTRVIHDNNPNGDPQPIRLSEFIRPGDIIIVEESFF